MAFGALLPCEECKGQFVIKSDAYYCSGDITAWTKCVAKTQTPNRKDWVIPKVGVCCNIEEHFLNDVCYPLKGDGISSNSCLDAREQSVLQC